LEKLLLQRAQGDKFVKLELDFQKAGMVIGRDSTEALILASLGIINMPNIEWDGGNSEFGQYYQIIQKKLSINTLAA
jgi:hypothetical protein